MDQLSLTRNNSHVRMSRESYLQWLPRVTVVTQGMLVWHKMQAERPEKLAEANQ